MHSVWPVDLWRYSDLVMRLQRSGCCQCMMGGGGEVAGVGGGLETGEKEGCITDEIGAERQLQYICLVLTHVAFDFQCEVQKSFIMTQLLRDVCACVCVLECVCVFSPLLKVGWRVGGLPKGFHR